MNIIYRLTVLSVLASPYIYAEVENSENRERSHSVKQVIQKVGGPEKKKTASVNDIRSMFEEGILTGHLVAMYSGHKVDNDVDPYATAVGGQLKYELGVLNGFNAGIEFTTSHDIDFATGDDDKHNPYISSSEGSYTQVSQVYANYAYEGLNLRLGRQLIDTPFADSDDIRIISNTFEAAIASYEVNDFSLMAGYLDRWQGTDAGLDVDNPWQETGKEGTYFGGISYANPLVDARIWYYDMSETDALSNTLGQNIANKTAYADLSFHIHLTQDYFLHLSAQYSDQSESDKSGTESKIYGFMGELVIMEDLAFSMSYNRSEKRPGKQSFSGFGGGTLYTNMDNMIIDNITADRDAEVFIFGGTYTYKDLGLIYAYGDFDGDADSSGQKEHIIEQDIGFEYAANENLTISGICVINDDKEDTGSNAYFNEGDFVNYRIAATYNF